MFEFEKCNNDSSKNFIIQLKNQPLYKLAFVEEIWKSDTCVSTKQSKKYLCHRKGSQKCIDYSDVCDFHAECEDNEDEDPQVHKCSKFSKHLKITIPFLRYGSSWSTV